MQHKVQSQPATRDTDQPAHTRQRYHAMTAFADAMVGNVTAALRARGMWESTLMVLTTDNGGPIHERGAGGVAQRREAHLVRPAGQQARRL